MKKINGQRNDYAILKSIRDCLTLEEFSEFISCIEKDSRKFIENLVNQSILIKKPDLIGRVDEKNDLCNIKVRDFISYHYTKGENPIEKLFEAYKLLSKDLRLPTAFITGNFQSISFEQIPEHPIGSKRCFYYENFRSLVNIVQPEKLYFDKWGCVEINFSEKKNVTIKAKNNIIELSL